MKLDVLAVYWLSTSQLNVCSRTIPTDHGRLSHRLQSRALSLDRALTEQRATRAEDVATTPRISGQLVVALLLGGAGAVALPPPPFAAAAVPKTRPLCRAITE